jgi:hypothetical protein
MALRSAANPEPEPDDSDFSRAGYLALVTRAKAIAHLLHFAALDCAAERNYSAFRDLGASPS